jgi:two-component system NarL family sensor kinase
VRRPVAQFALAGLVVLAVFGAAALLALRSLADDEALRDARQFAVLAGQGIVEPAIEPRLLDGNAAAVDAVDRIVNERVLGERVVRVKLWDTTGRVVYSDEPRLIGSRYPLDPAKREVLRTGATRAELGDLSGPENRFERGQGDLYEVYVPVRAPDGTLLLFETYQRRSEVAATGRRIWLPFAVLLLGSLVLLWLVQVPLAWRLGRRLQRTQEDRAALLERAVEASADERRRIAADLHDGPVQDLAGISYSLSAAAEAEGSPATRATLRDAANATRGVLRRLRTLLVEIHPPNLRASGLEAALDDLLAPLRSHGLETELAIEPDAVLDEADEQLLYRAAAEALRNVERHAGATRVEVKLQSADGAVRLEVADDGTGFTGEERARRREQGHLGLSLVEGLAEHAGATVDVRSTPGAGTTFTLTVPRR